MAFVNFMAVVGLKKTCTYITAKNGYLRAPGESEVEVEAESIFFTWLVVQDWICQIKFYWGIEIGEFYSKSVTNANIKIIQCGKRGHTPTFDFKACSRSFSKRLSGVSECIIFRNLRSD